MPFYLLGHFVLTTCKTPYCYSMAPTSIPQLIFHLILFHLLLCVFPQRPQNHNITLGSTLTANNATYKWVSPNGVFAFGFYRITPTLYIVGLWFDNISPKTLTWTPIVDKRDLPVKEGCTLQLTKTGLNLYDAQRNLKWSAAAVGENLYAGAVLDSGNFVLLDASFQPIWQSFDYPTDTLLPGQMLKWKSTLYSKASNTNYSSGRFELDLQADGNLVLYPVDRAGQCAGWSSRTDKIGDNPSSLIFNQSGVLYLVNATNMTVWIASGDTGSGQFLRRVTLDTYGILAQYVWNLNDNTSWSSIWKPVSDPCKDGKDQCGRNGICRLSREDLNTPECICPPGFDFIENEDPFKGCFTNSSNTCTASSTMLLLENTDWLNGNDYSMARNVSESECQQSCIDDCMCVVVTYGNSACWKKRMPLIDGRQGSDITNKAFVKVINNSQLHPPLPPTSGLPKPGKEKGKVLVVIGVSLVGCSLAIVSAGFLSIWLCGYVPNSRNKVVPRAARPEGLNAFTFKEIETATEGLRQELGRGAFGKVYKGTLPEGRAIAVKTLDKLGQEDQGDMEFRTEMRVIGTSHHKNLVQLYGFCDEGSNRILVYEYMSNGSLDRALFVESGFLDWRLRTQIAIGIARGMLYLHEECRSQILHCDIKPQNILLDENYNPKISDFGLAKLLRAEQTRTFTGARGTRGYIAPEWHKYMPITVKVDVYSFGVMLLEIICCRKFMKLDAPENEIILSEWAYECLRHGRLVQLAEQQLFQGNTVDPKQLERMALVALWCIQEDPSLRPFIKKVVQMLEGTVEIPVPPPPESFVSSL